MFVVEFAVSEEELVVYESSSARQGFGLSHTERLIRRFPDYRTGSLEASPDLSTDSETRCEDIAKGGAAGYSAS